MQSLANQGIEIDGMTRISLYESSVGLATIVTFIAIYLGIIFLITSSAILALKQLTESSDNRQRYLILRKIGCDEKMINKFGSELAILQDIPTDEISKQSTLLGEAITRLRAGKVIKHAGYDGEYGVIRLFEDNELVKKGAINLKLKLDLPATAKKNAQI